MPIYFGDLPYRTLASCTLDTDVACLFMKRVAITVALCLSLSLNNAITSFSIISIGVSASYIYIAV